jgi:hypothetical protein
MYIQLWIDGEKWKLLREMAPTEVEALIRLMIANDVEDTEGNILKFKKARVDLGATVARMDIFLEIK